MPKRFVFLSIVLLLAASLNGCRKTQQEVYGIVKDFTGLDGCGLMIQLDNGEKLEILSLPAGTSLLVNQRVAIIYRTRPAFSICMAGTSVEILRLRYI